MPKEYTVGSHCGYQETLEKKLGTKLPHLKKLSHLKTGVDTVVHHYGIRGGHGYWNDEGHWTYGERPTGVLIPKMSQDIPLYDRPLESPEDHVKDILHTELNIKDSEQFLAASPTNQIVHFKNEVRNYMETRGFSRQEAEEAYTNVRKELERSGQVLQPVQWKTGTAKESILEKELDDKLKLWLRRKGIAQGHEGEALVAMPKEQWDEAAFSVAQMLYTNPYKHIGADPEETVQEQMAQNKKRVLERIMEIRYQTQYLESLPEHPNGKQMDFDDWSPETWGVMAPKSKESAANHALKKLKDVIWNTDRFNKVAREDLPLKLAMDPETGPLLAAVGPRSALMLSTLYGHAFNTDVARYLAGFAHAARTTNMSEDMALINNLVTDATVKEEFVTVDDLKAGLKKTYGPKFWAEREAQSNWEAIAYQLTKAGMTDVADVIGEAFVPPVSSLKAVPLGEHPLTHEIEPEDYEPGDNLYREWASDISSLDYEKETSQEDIDEYINDNIGDIESDLKRQMAQEWMDEHPEEYDRILENLIGDWMGDNPGELERLQEIHDDDVARSHFYDAAHDNVAYRATSDFRDLAEEEVEDDVSEKAQEIAQEQAEDYVNTYGSGGEYEDREKAKIDIMNTLGAMLEKDHGITPQECRAFFNVISSDVDDDHVANARNIDRMIAGATTHLVGCWAGSSDGDHPVSNAMQILIPEIFPEVPAWEEKPEHAGDSAWRRAQQYAQDPEFAKVASAFLKSMYEHTQQEFKNAGVTHIVVARGVQGGLTPEIEQSLKEGRSALQGTAGYIKGTSNFITNPMTSWSWSAATSEGFSTPEHVVFVAKVPIERVIGTFRTGYGCLEEEEAVVLGGGGTCQWYGLARGNTHVGRPAIVTRAIEAKPNAPRTLAMEEHEHFKSTYVPGSAYDADTKQIIKGTISKAERIHNDEARSYNQAVLTEKGQRIAAGLRAAGIITPTEEEGTAKEAASLTGQVSGKHSPTAMAIYKLATEMPTMMAGVAQNSYRRQIQIDDLVSRGVPVTHAEDVHDAMYGKFVKKSLGSSRLQKAVNRAIALSRKTAYIQGKEKKDAAW